LLTVTEFLLLTGKKTLALHMAPLWGSVQLQLKPDRYGDPYSLRPSGITPTRGRNASEIWYA
jgi:hypothetical protein